MKQKNDSSSPFIEPTHEEITRYAHRIYIQSGYLAGRDLSNWLEAENMLRLSARQSPPPGASSSKPGSRSRRKSLNDGPIQSDLDSKAIAEQLDQEFSPPASRSPTSL